MDDTNINTLSKTSVSEEYINLIQSKGFSQLIFEATRITENSQSCIDHIFTNISTSCSSGSLAVEIADHLPVFTILYDPKFSPFPDYFEFRDFRRFITSDCLIDLIKETISSLDKGLYVVSLFLDLSKAFSTVNHQILLNKLKYYGLQQGEYNWFQSYLSNRKRQVHANGAASDTRFISTCVPQRSILGPLLFIIFINDLPKSSTFFSTRLYADDTSLTASGSDLDSLLREINNHLPAVYEWLCSNKLTLNLTKTKFLIFMPRQKESYNLYPPLTVANVHLEKSFCVKYLGVYIDGHLTWHDHIDYICGKIK